MSDCLTFIAPFFRAIPWHFRLTADPQDIAPRASGSLAHKTQSRPRLNPVQKSLSDELQTIGSAVSA